MLWEPTLRITPFPAICVTCGYIMQGNSHVFLKMPWPKIIGIWSKSFAIFWPYRIEGKLMDGIYNYCYEILKVSYWEWKGHMRENSNCFNLWTSVLFRSSSTSGNRSLTDESLTALTLECIFLQYCGFDSSGFRIEIKWQVVQGRPKTK